MKIKITHKNTSVEYTNDVVLNYDFIRGLIQDTISAIEDKTEKDALETFKLTEWSKTPPKH